MLLGYFGIVIGYTYIGKVLKKLIGFLIEYPIESK